MWFSSLLLLIAFSSEIEEEEKDLFGHEFWIGYLGRRQVCFRDFEKLDINIFMAASKGEQMKTLCPLIFNYFDCLDVEMENKFGNSLEEIAQFLVDRGEVEGNLFTVAVNINNVLKDVCTNGTQLNTDIKADLDCFDSIDEVELFARCFHKMDAALFHDYGMVNKLAETEEDYYNGMSRAEQDCMTSLFLAACASSEIREKCGQRAFNTFNTILKRTTVFPNEICSRERLFIDIEETKTTLVDLLNMTETEKDLFKLGLDLKRRK